MANEVKILGYSEMQTVLRTLPSKVSYKVNMQALRLSARKLVAIVRKETPKSSGNLKKSIGTISSNNKQKPAVLVAVRIGRKWKYSGWYAWFIHAGTSGFGARTKRSTNKKQSGLEYSSSGSGLKADPFFKRGADKGLPIVLNSLKESYSKAIVRYLQKSVPRYK